MKKLPIIDVPEIFSLNSKYEYFEYSPDESFLADQTKRKILLSGTTSINPAVPPLIDFSQEITGTREDFGIPEGVDSIKRSYNDESNVSSADVSSFRKSFSESVLLMKEKISEFSQSGASPQALFREATNWTFLDGGADSNIVGYLDNRFIGDATFGVLKDVQEQAISNFESERETLWKIVASSDGARTIYRLGIFIQIIRKSLWGGEPLYEKEEKIIFFENSTPSSWTYSLDALHGWEYKISVKNLFLISLSDRNENSSYAIVSSRFRTTKLDTFFFDRPMVVTDLRGVWDFDKDCLKLQWSYPLDRLNIIKKIQIFRRKDLDSPYKLLREFDWNDNQVEWAREYNESVPRRLVTKPRPPDYWYDKDFEPRSGSVWHYSICTISTHGTSSNYSIQTTVRWINSQKGVANGLLSRSGAPKAYPNKLLETKAITREGIANNTVQIRDSEKITIFLNPEANKVINQNGDLLMDLEKKGWAFNFINHENLENFQAILKTIETESESIRRENTDTGE